jgi:hypothetical protein
MSPEPQASHPLASPAASDVFPPPRSQAADPSIFMPYPSEDLAFEEEYEEYLFDLQHANQPDMVTTDSAPSWTEIPNDQPIGEGISDSESVVSIGDGLPADNTGPDGKTVFQEDSEVGKNNWEASTSTTISTFINITDPVKSLAYEPEDPQCLAQVPRQISGWRRKTVKLRYRLAPGSAI